MMILLVDVFIALDLFVLLPARAFFDRGGGWYSSRSRSDGGDGGGGGTFFTSPRPRRNFNACGDAFV